nr:MAG TPA: hypothetical protein [Caudoviricetes sp.]
MSTINIPRESTMQEIAQALNLIAISVTGQTPEVSTWASVQRIVRSGFGPKAFPIGSQLRVQHETYGEIIWDVVAHDYDKDPNGRMEHSMTLLSHDCIINSIQFDNTEALYFAEETLVAGTYHFTLLPGYDEAYGGGKTLQFTLIKDVPAGGVIMFPWGYQQQVTAAKISTYETQSSTAALESVDVTEGTGGTDLGTADGKGTLNHTHRIRYGSNNWKESALRQLLNSDKAAGTFWTPQTKYDRSPTWNASIAGFMAGLPADFLEVVGICSHITKSNSIHEEADELNSSYETQDRFWLASYSEVFGGMENNVEDGTQYPYYSGGMAADRIKYNSSGAARYWWLRSPNHRNAINVRLVSPNGSQDSDYAYEPHGAAVACAIY